MKTMKRLLALLLALAMVMPNCMTIASAYTEDTVEAGELVEEISEILEEELVEEEILDEELTEEIPELVEEVETVVPEEVTDAQEALNAQAQETEASEEEEAAFEELTYTLEQEESNDALFAAYVQNVLWPREWAVYGITGRQALVNMGETASDALLAYDALKPILESIAAGERTNTAITIGFDTGLAEKIGQFSGNDLSLTMDALLADLPYDMYWYDKVTGILSGNITISNSDDSLAGYQVVFYFAVAEDYRSADPECYTSKNGTEYYHTTSALLTGAAAATVAAAQKVVADVAAANPDATDYEKIAAYKNWIRGAVTYDHSAANGGDSYFIEEIDPWQVIHVFDGDPDTNVVCEGYSKALQFLCDLTTFSDSDTYVYTVTGDLYVGDSNRGGHMWNIVSLDGGKYLADLTNCGGYDVFLVGGEPGESGYSFDGLGYIYDSETLDFYDSDMLTLSTSNYLKEEIDSEESGSSDAVTYDPISLHDALYSAEYGSFFEVNNQLNIDVGFGQGCEEPGVFRIPAGMTVQMNQALNLLDGLKLIVEQDAALYLAEGASITINGGSELLVEGNLNAEPGSFIHVGAQNDAGAAVAGTLCVTGSMQSSAWLNVADATSVVKVDGILVQSVSYIQNAGSVAVNGELVVQSALVLEETASLEVNNSLIIEGGMLDVSHGTVTGSGAIRANIHFEGTEIVGMENIPETVSCMANFGGIQDLETLEAALTADVTGYDELGAVVVSAITIPEGKTLTVPVNSTLTIGATQEGPGSLTIANGAALNVEGTLRLVGGATVVPENGGYIIVSENATVYLMSSELFVGNGEIALLLNGEATLTNVPMEAVQRNWQVSSLEELTAALENASDYGYNQIVTNAGFDLTGMTIPANVHLNMRTVDNGERAFMLPAGEEMILDGTLSIKPGNVLTVKEDASIVVNGTLNNYGTINNNGSIGGDGTIYNEGTWEGNDKPGATEPETGVTESEVAEALKNGNYTLQEDLTVNYVFDIPAGRTLTVAEGVTLTNNGQINIFGNLNIQGSLENNMGIFLVDNGGLTVTGTVTNNYMIEMVGVNAWANFDNGEYIHGSFEENGETYAADFVVYFNGEGDRVTGVDNSNLFLHYTGSDASIFSSISRVTNQGGYAGWSVAVDGTMTVNTMVDMTNVFVLDGGELIINTTGDMAYANRKLIVREGGTLTVNGELMVYGALNIHEGATLNNNGTIISGVGLNGNGSIQLYGEYNHGEGAELQFETYMADELTFNDVPNIDNGLKTIVSHIDNAHEVLRAALDFGWSYGASEVFLNGDHTIDWSLHLEGNRRLHICGNLTMDAGMDMANGAYLAVMPGGSLTTNAPVILNGGSHVDVRGAQWDDPAAVLTFNEPFHVGLDNSVGAETSGLLSVDGIVNANGYFNICPGAKVEINGTLNHNAYNEETGLGGIIVENHGTIHVASGGVMNVAFDIFNIGQFTVDGKLNVTTGSVEISNGGRMDLNAGAAVSVADEHHQIMAWNRGSLINNGADLSGICTAGIQVHMNEVTEYKNIPANLIYASYFVNSEEELHAAIADQSGKGYGFVQFVPKQSFSLTENLTIPSATLLQLWNYNENLTYAITVPAGKTLTNNGKIIINSGTKINVYGTLDTTAGLIDVTGNNRGNENLLFGILYRHNDGTVLDNAAESNIHLNGGVYQNGDSAQDELESALANGNWVLDTQVTLTEDFEVNGNNLYLDSTGVIIVPKDVTMTVHSVVKTIGGKIIVQNGGTLVIRGHMELLEGDVIVMPGGEVIFDGGDCWGHITWVGDEESTATHIGAYWVHPDNEGNLYVNHNYVLNRQMRMAIPQGFDWMFVLRQWDSEALAWIETPIAPEDLVVGPHLKLYHVSENNWMQNAADGYTHLYPCFVEVATKDNALWNTDTYVGYNYNNELLTMPIRLERNFDHGFYSSEIASDGTWLTMFEANPAAEETSFYYILTKEGYTIQSAEITRDDGQWTESFEQVSENVYKLTMKQDVIANLWHYDGNTSIDVSVTAVDGDGNTWRDTANIWNQIWFPDVDAALEMSIQEDPANAPIDRHFELDADFNGGTWFYHDYDPELNRYYRVVAQLPEGVSYDCTSNTLTLDNANILDLRIGYNWTNEETGESGTNLPRPNLTLKLKGTNNINPYQGTCGLVFYGGIQVYVEAEDGAVLNIECTNPQQHSAAIDVTPDSGLILNDGVVINVGNADLMLGGTVNMNGGEINATYSGFRNDGTLNMRNGTITLNDQSAIQLTGAYFGNDAKVVLNNSVMRVFGRVDMEDNAQFDINIGEGILDDGYDYGLLIGNRLVMKHNSVVNVDVEGVGTQRVFQAVRNLGTLDMYGGTMTVNSDSRVETNDYKEMVPAFYCNNWTDIEGGILNVSGQIGYKQDYVPNGDGGGVISKLLLKQGELNADGEVIGIYLLDDTDINGGMLNASAACEANSDTNVWPQALRMEREPDADSFGLYITGGEHILTATDTGNDAALSKAMALVNTHMYVGSATVDMDAEMALYVNTVLENSCGIFNYDSWTTTDDNIAFMAEDGTVLDLMETQMEGWRLYTFHEGNDPDGSYVGKLTLKGGMLAPSDQNAFDEMIGDGLATSDSIEITGDVRLNANLILTNNAVLTVRSGATLTITEGVVLAAQDNSRIVVEEGGCIDNYGTLASDPGDIEVNGEYIHEDSAFLNVHYNEGEMGEVSIDTSNWNLIANVSNNDQIWALHAIIGDKNFYGVTFYIIKDIVIDENTTVKEGTTWEVENGSTITVEEGQILSIAATGVLKLNDGSLVVKGELVNHATLSNGGAKITVTETGAFRNYSTLKLDGATVVNVQGELENNGHITITNDSVLTVDGYMNNAGKLSVGEKIDSGGYRKGYLNVNGTLDTSGDLRIHHPESCVNIDGTLNKRGNDEDNYAENNGNLVINGTLNVEAGAFGGNGEIQVNGIVNVENAVFNVFGDMTLKSPAGEEETGGSVTVYEGGTLNVNNDSGLYVELGAQLINAGGTIRNRLATLYVYEGGFVDGYVDGPITRENGEGMEAPRSYVGAAWYNEEYFSLYHPADPLFTSMTMAPGEQRDMIFYEMSWNEETMKWNYYCFVPVVNSEYLSVEQFDTEGDPWIAEFRVHVRSVDDENAWDQNVQIHAAHTYLPDEEFEPFTVEIGRDQNHGFYSSDSEFNNKTWLKDVELDPYSGEDVTVYYAVTGAEGYEIYDYSFHIPESVSLDHELLDGNVIRVTIPADQIAALESEFSLDIQTELQRTDDPEDTMTWYYGVWCWLTRPDHVEFREVLQIDNVDYRYAPLYRKWFSYGEETYLPGTVSYDPENAILTLNSESLQSLEVNYIPGGHLTINLEGDSTIYNDEYHAMIFHDGISGTITSSTGGTLHLHSDNGEGLYNEERDEWYHCGALVTDGADLTISGNAQVTSEVSGKAYWGMNGVKNTGMLAAVQTWTDENDNVRNTLTICDEASLTTVLNSDLRHNVRGSEYDGEYVSIHGFRNVTVSDDATVNIQSLGVRDGSFSMTGGTVNIDSLPSLEMRNDGNGDYIHAHYEGIYTEGGQINISGGKLIAELFGDDLSEYEVVSSWARALGANGGTINITGGELIIATGLDASGIDVGSKYDENGRVPGTGSTLNFGGTAVLRHSGDLIRVEQPENVFGYRYGMPSAIWADNQSTVNFNGGTIYAEKSNIGMEGDASWNGTELFGTSVRVFAGGEFTMNSGLMAMEGAEIPDDENYYNNALFSDYGTGNVTLNGGEIRMENGVLAANCAVNINGATVTIDNEQPDFQGAYIGNYLQVNKGQLNVSVPGGSWTSPDGSITEVYPAIWNEGTLHIMGGEVNAVSETTGAIRNLGELLINAGTVNADGNVGIVNLAENSQGVLFTNGGVLNATGKENGILNMGYFENLGGEVNVTATDAAQGDFYPTAFCNEAELDENGEIPSVPVSDEQSRPMYGLYMAAGSLNVQSTGGENTVGIYSGNAPIHFVYAEDGTAPNVTIDADTALTTQSNRIEGLLVTDLNMELVGPDGSLLSMVQTDSEDNVYIHTLMDLSSGAASQARLEAYSMTQAKLEAALRSDYTLTENVVIYSDMTIDKTLTLAEGVILTLANGAKVTVNKALNVNKGAQLAINNGIVSVRGTLTNLGIIHVLSNGILENNGSMMNIGSVELAAMGQMINNAECINADSGSIVLPNMAYLSNSGRFVNVGSFETLDGAEVHNDGLIDAGDSAMIFAEGTYFSGENGVLQVGYLLDDNGELMPHGVVGITNDNLTLFHPIRQSFANHDESSMLAMMETVQNQGYAGGVVWLVDKNVEITDHARIPAEVDVYVGMTATPAKLTIAQNALVIVEGGLYVNSVNLNRNHTLENNGVLQIAEAGEVKILNGAKYTQTANANLERRDLLLNEGVPGFTGAVEGIASGMQTVYATASNAADIQAVTNFVKAGKYKFGSIRIYGDEQPFVLEEDLTIDTGISVAWSGDLINEAVLTVKGSLHIGSEDAAIYNNGILKVVKGATVGILGSNFHGNTPTVDSGAVTYPHAEGVNITSIAYSNTTMINADAVTMDTVDARSLKLETAVTGQEDVLQRVTWTSSNKKVLDPADILFDEVSGGYYIREGASIGTGTTKLTATTVAASDAGKKFADFISITVEAVKAAELILTPEAGSAGDTEVILEKEDVVQSFTITPEAMDKHQEVFVLTNKNIKWTSSDTKIATVAVDTNGVATVTVKAKADGVAVITAQLTQQKEITAQLKVEVRDYTPRLVAANLTVNPMLSAGIPIELVESYENTIYFASFDEAQLNNILGDGEYLEVVYNENEEPTVVYTVDEGVALKNKTLKPVLYVDTLMGVYEFPMSIIIKSVTPSVTVKQPEKLDLFFNDSRAALNVEVKNETITGMELMDTEDFTLEENADGTYDIVYTQSLLDAYAENPKYSPDLKGNLVIELEGYAYPIEKSVSIGTTKSSMSLATDANATTFYTALEDIFTTSFQVYDKKAKENLTDFTIECTNSEDCVLNVIEESGRVTADFTEAVKVKLNLDVRKENWMLPVTINHQINVNASVPTAKLSPTTLNLSNLFRNQKAESNVTLSIAGFQAAYFLDKNGEYDFLTTAAVGTDAYIEASKISVTFDAATQKITASWSDSDSAPKAGSYTYKAVPYTENGTALKEVSIKVTVKNDKPSVKLMDLNVNREKTTLKLSNLFTEQTDDTSVTTTNGLAVTHFVNAEEFENVFLTAAKAGSPAADEAEKIDVIFEDGMVKASVKPGQEPKAGTYSYKAVPYIGNEALKEVTVKVQVVNTKPTVKLSTGTAKLNTELACAEYVEIPVSFTNNTGFDLSLQSFTADSMADVNNTTVQYVSGHNDPKYVGTLKVMLTGVQEKNTNSVYNLIPVAVDGNGTEVELAAVKLTVSPFTKDITVAQSSKGKIDTVDPASAITYTITKINNATGLVVTDVALLQGGEVFAVSEITSDTKGNPAFELYRVGLADLKQSYKVQFQYTLSDAEGDFVTTVDSSVLGVKVSQSALKLTAPVVTYYQSQATPLDVSVTLAGPVNALMENVTINTAKSSKELVAALGLTEDKLYQQVNSTEFAPEDLQILDNAAVAAGKSYKLVLDVSAVGHADNANTTQISVTVKVLK